MKLYQHTYTHTYTQTQTHTHTHTHTHTVCTHSQVNKHDDDIENAQSGFTLNVDHNNRYGKLVQETDQKNTQHNRKKQTNGKRTYT